MFGSGIIKLSCSQYRQYDMWEITMIKEIMARIVDLANGGVFMTFQCGELVSSGNKRHFKYLNSTHISLGSKYAVGGGKGGENV